MPLCLTADTNIVFSGLYFGGSAKPLIQAISIGRVDIYQSEYLQNELTRISVEHGFTQHVIDAFYALPNVHVITEDQTYSLQDYEIAKQLVRDPKDVPVYLFAKAMLQARRIDYFATGDGDLLTRKVKETLPGKVITLAELNQLFSSFD